MRKRDHTIRRRSNMASSSRQNERPSVVLSRMEDRLSNPEKRWIFTADEVERSPSRIHGIDTEKEMGYRQSTANFIQDMGHRLKLNQLCIATAIVYMHRFFMIHSFKMVNRWTVASASLFLAAKVEEQPQKLEHVARVYHAFINNGADIDPVNDSSAFSKVVDDITHHELVVLQTLGFEMQVEHPHPHVAKCTQLVRASKDLCQMAYIMAHNSLLLTTFCLKYSPKVIACVCLNLACEWKGIEIPPSQDQKKWWEYIETSITENLLKSLTREFLEIYSKCPSKLHRKIGDQIKLTHGSGEMPKPALDQTHSFQSNQRLQQKSFHHSGKENVPSSSSQSARPVPSTSSHHPRPHHHQQQQPQQPHSSSKRTFGLTHGQSASLGMKPQQSRVSSEPSQLPPPQVSRHHHHHHHNTQLPVHGKNAAVAGHSMPGSEPPKPHHPGGQQEGKAIVVPRGSKPPQQSTAHHHASQQRNNSKHQHEVTQRSEVKDRSHKHHHQAPPPGSSSSSQHGSTCHKHPQAHLAVNHPHQSYHNQQPCPQYPPTQQPRPQYPPTQQPRPQYPPTQQPRPQYPPTQQQRNALKRSCSQTGAADSGDVAWMESSTRKKPKMEFSQSMLSRP